MEVIESVTITQVRESQEMVSRDVRYELDRQLGKWGTQHHLPLYWVGILGEEYGEVCKEAIEWGLHKAADESRAALYEELTHVAAVAIAAAECLRRTLVGEGER
jgi:hypothetical protein